MEPKCAFSTGYTHSGPWLKYCRLETSSCSSGRSHPLCWASAPVCATPATSTTPLLQGAPRQKLEQPQSAPSICKALPEVWFPWRNNSKLAHCSPLLSPDGKGGADELGWAARCSGQDPGGHWQWHIPAHTSAGTLLQILCGNDSLHTLAHTDSLGSSKPGFLGQSKPKNLRENMDGE